ncbi:MAG: hypothetical protein BGO77_02520 [Caedibacter sp. 37-49]|nr:MAG: hypothetical protein BGO77_02520 [Caedibacter sp. 37-49]
MKLLHNQNRRSLFSWISFLLILTICIAYTYLWFRQAHWLENNIRYKIVQLQQTQNLNLEHESIKITGFPWKLEVKISNPRLTSTKWGSSFFQIDGRLEVEATAWSPRTIVVNTLGKTKFIYAPKEDFAPLMLECEDLQGSFEIRDKDYVFKSLQLYNVDGKLHKTKFKLEEMMVSSLPQTSSITSSGTSIAEKQIKSSSFSLRLYRLQLTEQQMTKIPSLVELLETTFHLEEEINFSAPKPLEEWTKKGGFLEIEKLSFEWASLKGEGNGTFALDHNLQPLAAFTAKVSGLDAFFDQLAQDKIIRKNVASIVKLSLGLLKDKSSQHTVALSLQKGDLSVGPITIAKLPKITWPSR